MSSCPHRHLTHTHTHTQHVHLCGSTHTSAYGPRILALLERVNSLTRCRTGSFRWHFVICGSGFTYHFICQDYLWSIHVHLVDWIFDILVGLFSSNLFYLAPDSCSLLTYMSQLAVFLWHTWLECWKVDLQSTQEHSKVPFFLWCYTLFGGACPIWAYGWSYLAKGYLGGTLHVSRHLPLLPEHLLYFILSTLAGTKNPPLLSPVPNWQTNAPSRNNSPTMLPCRDCVGQLMGSAWFPDYWNRISGGYPEWPLGLALKRPLLAPKPLPSQNNGGQCAPEEPRLHWESRGGLLPISRNNDTILNATKSLWDFPPAGKPECSQGLWEDRSNLLI